MYRVLVTEPIHEEGLTILKEDKALVLEEKLGLSRGELLDIVGEYEGILTRSGTGVDKDLLDAAKKLRVLCRAGVGVDNIDLLEASRRGIVVINAPTGNTLAAAELTMANILGLLRHIPRACDSVFCGKWERKRFMGTQLEGKKLLIVGLGRIGGTVAKRARAFGMDLYAYDPYVSPKKAETLGVTLCEDFLGALSLADLVTLHVPLTKETRGMMDETSIRAMKKGSFLINCARGSLVDEEALAEALRSGRLEGAAFDVYSTEPLQENHPLLAQDIREKVVLTPHIGANTREGQSAVARIAAKNLAAALKGEPYEHAVNLPFMESQLSKNKRAFLSLSRKLGNMGAQLISSAPGTLRITLKGELFFQEDKYNFEIPYNYSPFTVAALKGVLEVYHGADVSYMAAPLIADEREMGVQEGREESSTYRNMVVCELQGEKEKISLAGTVTEEGKQRIVNVNGYWVECVPEGRILLFQNHDRPGVIGRIGSLLGERGINIANFALGRKNGSGLAIGMMQIDHEVPGEVMRSLMDGGDFLWAVDVHLAENL